MVPCPWFLEAVAWKRKQPDVDLGVHLTLTSEWAGYRWGPVSTRSRASGLIDEQGYLHRTTEAVRNHATRDAARAELQAQVDRADELGLAPTHIDTHMFVAMCDKFQEDYVQIGFNRKIPAFLPRAHGKSASERQWFQQQANEWETRGQPVFDCYRVATHAVYGEERYAFVREMFAGLPAGLSCILLHPAIDTPEVRHMTDDWRSRVADFETFRNPSLRDQIHNLGIHLISYRPLRDAMRTRLRRCSD
jgi:predicted glycoside hydrolase/deacetylase ChbG (UPF0249 family)